MNQDKLNNLVSFYEQLTPESVSRMGEFYAEDAYFKDPFNEVRGVSAISRIFTLMYDQVSEPRFVVEETVQQERTAMLIWVLHFRSRRIAGGAPQQIRGVSHLRFDSEGRVSYHRDYWDAAEELYAKLPAIGCLVRGLKRMVSA